jgi:hypothetical protein
MTALPKFIKEILSLIHESLRTVQGENIIISDKWILSTGTHCPAEKQYINHCFYKKREIGEINELMIRETNKK